MHRYLREEAINVTAKSLLTLSGTNDWSLQVKDKWPQHDNGNDCGVFTVIGCECEALHLNMMMSAERSLFFREKIAIDLISSRLT